MMIDYADLHTILTTDPAGMGFGPLVAAGSDQDCADLLNERAGPGAGTVGIGPIGKDPFLMIFAPIIGAVLMWLANTAANQSNADYPTIYALKYLLEQSTVIDTSAPTFTNGMAAVKRAVKNPDGSDLWTDAQMAVMVTRPASMAEVRYGSGTLILHEDVAKAMGRG